MEGSGTKAHRWQQIYQQILQQELGRQSLMLGAVKGFGVALYDHEGLLQMWNEGAVRLTGLTADRVVQRPYQQHFREEDRDLAQKNLSFARRYGHLRDEQARMGHEQTLEVYFSLDIVRDPKSGECLGFVEIFQDITAQKARELSLLYQATRDPLTHLYNRRYFTEEAQKELIRSQNAYPLSLAIIDLDHFKQINDRHGHDLGDQVLVRFAKCLERHSKAIDLTARLGGEEFVWLMPRLDKASAAERCNQLRLELQQQSFEGETGRFSAHLSAGIATLRPHMHGLKELMRCADNALYQAKRGGRNQVHAWFE